MTPVVNVDSKLRRSKFDKVIKNLNEQFNADIICGDLNVQPGDPDDRYSGSLKTSIDSFNNLTPNYVDVYLYLQLPTSKGWKYCPPQRLDLFYILAKYAKLI